MSLFRRGARHDGVRRVRSRERGHARGESSRGFHGYDARATPPAPRSLRALDVSHPRADERGVDRHPLFRHPVFPPPPLAGRKASDEDKPWKRAPKKAPSKVKVVPAESLLAANCDDDGPPQVSLVVASVSRAGADPSAKKPNQDACAAHPRDFATTSGAFFSVLDGHGPAGHHVARLARERIPGWLVEDPKRRALLRDDPSAALRRAFVAVDAELTDSGIDVQLSGAAVVACHIRGRRLTTAWVGDCRAVLGRESDGVVSAVALTKDHRPDDAEERARIEKMGGRVAAMLDGLDDDGKPLEVGPPRVWQSRAWVPGLAMSRSVGDAVARALGVVAEPSVDGPRLVDEDDRFLIVASDGVWEHVSNDEAVMIAAACDGPEEAAEKIADEAKKRWRKEEGSSDDVTVVVVAFARGTGAGGGA